MRHLLTKPIKIANNSVGAASNKKLLDEGGVCSYNDIKINFVELPAGIVIGAPKGSLQLNMDLQSDDNSMEVSTLTVQMLNTLEGLILVYYGNKTTIQLGLRRINNIKERKTPLLKQYNK
jgi:hypothetical protein